ncbi:MAG: aldo/keto reductase [Clostridia bacterium]|nr:aldo/keto reductase [Clostridia bacterium]
MKRIKIGNQFEASAIALGAMRMSGKTVDEAEKIVLTAYENGIDYVDHADIYGGGESENVFSKVLKRNPGLREKILLQDKVGICKGYYDASYEHIMEAADGCLKRLGVDYIDALLLHRPDALMEPEEVAEAYTRLQAQGKVRFFGVSNENAAQLMLLDKFMPGKIIINQLQFSICHSILVDEGVNVNMHTEHAQVLSGGVLDYCRLKDITVQAWSPFQYGMFRGVFLGSEKYPELNHLIKELSEKYGVSDNAIAIAWILRHPANIQAIAGSMNPKRIQEICAGGDIQLTRQEWYRLYLAAGNPLP